MRKQNLRHNVINQFNDAINNGQIRSPLPSQSTLADMYNISRTTVRHMLAHLHHRGVLEKNGRDYIILRMPKEDDSFEVLVKLPKEQLSIFEQAFYTMIDRQELRPGDTFSELQLAKQVGVNPVIVREFLIHFSRYNLIENLQRSHWRMMEFDSNYAEKLFELRELLETHALNRFMNLPEHDNRWKQAKELLYRHRKLRETVVLNYRAFSKLDHELHGLILSAADNPFFNQSMEIISVIFHFHYQWDQSESERT